MFISIYFSFKAKFITNSLKTFKVNLSSEVTFYRVSAQINLKKKYLIIFEKFRIK